jgi:hypothetical protein
MRPSMIITLRRVHLLGVLLAAALASACSTSFTVTRTRAELQRDLAPRFPVTRSELLFTVTLSNPTVLLRPGDQRVGVELDAEVHAPIGPSVRGRIAALGEPWYDREQKAFFIRKPVLERLDVKGLGSVHPKLREALALVAERALADTPVYRLEGRNRDESAAELLLKEVSVRDEKLVFTMSPL